MTGSSTGSCAAAGSDAACSVGCALLTGSPTLKRRMRPSASAASTSISPAPVSGAADVRELFRLHLEEVDAAPSIDQHRVSPSDNDVAPGHYVRVGLVGLGPGADPVAAVGVTERGWPPAGEGAPECRMPCLGPRCPALGLSGASRAAAGTPIMCLRAHACLSHVVDFCDRQVDADVGFHSGLHDAYAGIGAALWQVDLVQVDLGGR